MIIRDMYCTECGAIVEDVYLDRIADMEANRNCERCKKTTLHKARCNGGIRQRLRIFDWPTNPEYYRGQIKFGAPEAREGTPDGKPVEFSPLADEQGVVHEAKAAGHADREGEREDRRYHKLRKNRGTKKLFFDKASM